MAESNNTQIAVAGIRTDGIISVESVKRNREAIQHLLKDVLRNGINADYAAIPGTGEKLTLLKPGAEKIASLFGMAVEPIVEAIVDGDDRTFRVTTRFTTIASQAYLGSGIGEASTRESKYAWRAAVCEEEFQATDPHKRRVHWKKGFGNNGPTSVQQVREDPNDKMNTVLKMAKKRSMIDGILTITAASDTFTQDLESTLDRNSGKSTAPVSGAQVEAAMGEPVISQDDSRKFFGMWKNKGKHTKEKVQEYLKVHCGGITDDRKMPQRCYKAAMTWAATEGAPIPPPPEPPKQEAKPAPAATATAPASDDPLRNKIDQLFGILGVDLAAQAALLTEYAGRFDELAGKLEMELPLED